MEAVYSEILRIYNTEKGRAVAPGCVGAAGRPQSSQRGVKLMHREAIFVFTDVFLLHFAAFKGNFIELRNCIPANKHNLQQKDLF